MKRPKEWPPPPEKTYNKESLKELIEKEFAPRAIKLHLQDPDMDFEPPKDSWGISADLYVARLGILKHWFKTDELDWKLMINDNIDLCFKTGYTGGIKHRSIEEAIQYIKSFLLLVRKWEDWVDANTYWETEQTEQGTVLVQDIKRYENNDW